MLFNYVAETRASKSSFGQAEELSLIAESEGILATIHGE